MKEPQPEAIDLVFELSKDEYLKLLEVVHALDAKVVGIFGIGSIMIGVVAGLGQATFRGASVWDWILFGFAAFSFVITVLLCAFGLWRRRFVGPLNPARTEDLYLSKDASQIKKEHLSYVKDYYDTNLRHLQSKSFFAYWALPAVALEVALLFAWLLSSPFI